MKPRFREQLAFQISVLLVAPPSARCARFTGSSIKQRVGPRSARDARGTGRLSKRHVSLIFPILPCMCS